MSMELPKGWEETDKADGCTETFGGQQQAVNPKIYFVLQEFESCEKLFSKVSDI